MKYNVSSIEKKWRAIWDEKPINDIKTKGNADKKSFFCLDMFPYPSGTGLHVGHWRGYVISDVISRYKVMKGYNVLHPMGWDAFGLPAENYAIQIGSHPAKATEENIKNFKRQLKDISAIYNWDYEINTTDPSFYKWTQWIFVRMFKEGLAYEKEMPLNWCDNCKCVLANEEAANGECERCGSSVTKKPLRQWMLRITNYAERLLNDLNKLDWPEKVKKMQSDWIGKSYGAEVDFKILNLEQEIKVYTTRPDTLFGATFIVLSPEHSLVGKVTTPVYKDAVEQYVKAASAKSSVDRMSDKNKTGVFTGSYARNPLTKSNIPIYISDYVLVDYGTGAIMCVPAHDQRDFEFASKFKLPVVQVVAKDGIESKKLDKAYEDEGVLINSGEFNGLKTPEEAKDAIIEYIEQYSLGKRTVNYKLRDWVFSRQRYWGEPIPIIHCQDCGAVPVPENQLPVLLPDVESYLPTDTGESPLSAIDSFVNTICPVCGIPAKRETNTMPQWAGSSWYFLRYADPQNDEVIASKEAIKKWLPVEYYLGGIEHAVLHLLYARFYTKFLFDIDVVEFDEPFTKLFNQGMVNKDGIKMSKSKGNSVSPDELVEKYGCDSLRMYELFIGPPEQDCEWDDSGIDGVYRYLNRLWKFVMEYKDKPIGENKELVQIRHKMIYEITNRLENFTLNTVISGFMEFTNKLIDAARKLGGVDLQTIESLITMLAPFAPHISEEMWEITGHTTSVFAEEWPEYDEDKMKQDVIQIALQINGKLRDNIAIPADISKEDALIAAKECLKSRLEGTEIVKEIYVPGRIINFVIK